MGLKLYWLPFAYDPGNVAVPVTENVCNEILSLPVYPYIPQAYIVHILLNLYESLIEMDLRLLARHDSKEDVRRAYALIKAEAFRAYENKRYEKSLELIYLSAWLAWNYHIDLFCDDELENLLQKIGQKIVSSCCLPDIYHKGGKSIAFVASHLYDTGGHSRALTNYVKTLHDCDASINLSLYITNVDNYPTTAPFIINELISHGVEIKTLQWFEYYSTRVRELYTWLITDKPDVIVLFIHPTDVISVAAISAFKQNHSKNNVIFFNHADHVFWLGKNIIDTIIEYRRSGAKISLVKRRIPAEKITLIPHLRTSSSCKNRERWEKFLPKLGTVSLSIGSAYKMIDKEGIYFKTVKKLLDKHKGHFHIVITDSPSSIRKCFKKYGLKDNKRLIVIGPVMDPSYFYKKVDFVLETFPLAGGTVRYDAMYFGVPIIAYRNPNASFLTEPLDTLPPGYPYIASTSSEVLEIADELISDKRKREEVGRYLYNYYSAQYSQDLIRTKICKLILNNSYSTLDIGSLENVRIDYDAQYLFDFFKDLHDLTVLEILLMLHFRKKAGIELRTRFSAYLHIIPHRKLLIKKFGWLVLKKFVYLVLFPFGVKLGQFRITKWLYNKIL